MYRWMIIAWAAASLLAGTALARPMSIKGAAATAWKRHRSSDGVYSCFPFQGRNGPMETRVYPGSRGQASEVVVRSRTRGGRLRTTTFSVTGQQKDGPVVKRSSVLHRATVRRGRGAARAGRSSSGGLGRYHNADLESARGRRPGSVGHAAAVGRAGFYPDSIGVELQAGARRGSIAYERYWSNRGASGGSSHVGFGSLRSW